MRLANGAARFPAKSPANGSTGRSPRFAFVPSAVVEVDAAGLEEGDSSAPRARLPRAASSSEPSTVVRITDWSSESGLATRPVGRGRRRRGSAAAGLARVGEAPADDLVEAEVPHHVLGAAAQALLAAEAAELAGGRQGRGQVLVEAVDAADLLDQVDLAGDVVMAVGRHGDLQVRATGLHFESEPLEIGRLIGLGDLHAEQPGDP